MFYTGTQEWKYPTSIIEYFADPLLATEMLIDGAKLIQLRNISDEEISKHHDLTMLEIIQKHISEEDTHKLATAIAKDRLSGC